MLFVLKIISQLLFIQGVLTVNPNVLLFFNHLYHNRQRKYGPAKKMKKMNELLFYIHFLYLDTSVCVVDCYKIIIIIINEAYTPRIQESDS